MRPSILPTTLALLALAAAPACSSDSASTTDDAERRTQPSMTVEQSEDEGILIERLDTNGDGNRDIIRHIEEYQDPRDESRTRRRVRQLEIDLTGDGQINVRRIYDTFGNPEREENDRNLDGVMDSVLYYVGGEVTRKEYFDETGERVVERRIYVDGDLARVERDRNGDGEVDRWEYYEDNVLIRIGRDTVGDGAADTWQLR